MNTRLTLKRMPTADIQISDIVPAAGEIIMDATTSKLKIGDGVTTIEDLPWVADLAVVEEESSLSSKARMFIENNIELIENSDYDTLYSRIATPALAQEVTRALLKCELNPKHYLTNIPSSIRHLLEPDRVWAEDTTKLYTKSEIDAILMNL